MRSTVFMFLIALVTAIAVSACGESLAIVPDPNDTNRNAEGIDTTNDNPLGENSDSNLIRLNEGDSIAVKAVIYHEELEGGPTSFDVEALSSDDPNIIEVEPLGGARFVLHAKAAGETIVRASIDGKERGTTPIRVGPGTLVNGLPRTK